jgi:aspartate aminotransferase
MAVTLAQIPVIPPDEAFAITSEFNADRNPLKVSLGAGVYRDENAQPWVLPSVIEVCGSLLQ